MHTGLPALAFVVLSLSLQLGCLGLSQKGDMECTPGPHLEGAPSTVATAGYPYAAHFTGGYVCGLFICFSLEPEVLPPGATIDNFLKSVLWTPTADQIGTLQTFQVRTPADACGDSARFSWQVQVLAAPTITSFQALPEIIHPGETTQIVAQFAHGMGVVDSLGEVHSGVAVTTPPLAQSTSYLLRVDNGYGVEVTQTVTVQVVPAISPGGPLASPGPGFAGLRRYWRKDRPAPFPPDDSANAPAMGRPDGLPPP